MTRLEWEDARKALGRNTTSYRTITLFVFDVGLSVVAWALNSYGGWWVGVACLLQTLALVHCYLIHHEAVHDAIFQSRKLNRAFGHLLALIVAFPFIQRQRSHQLHHIWTGHPTGDPANDRAIRAFGNADAKTTKTIERMWKSSFPFFVINDRIGLWKNSFKEHRSQPHLRRYDEEIRWVWIYVGAYLSIALGLIVTGHFFVTMRYFLPALLLDMLIEEWANLPHHAETPLIESDKPLPFWEQAQVTHGCSPLPIWSRFIMLNFNLHIAHHAFPWLPWHRLPDAQRLIGELDPKLAELGDNEIVWGVTRRSQRKFMDVMGHYFIMEAHKRALLKIGRGKDDSRTTAA